MISGYGLTPLAPMLESLDLHQERNNRRLTALYTNIAVGPKALENLYRQVAD